MSLNERIPTSLLPATMLALVLALAPGTEAGAQVLQPGLQPGLTRSPDSARKISLDEAIRMAQLNSPAGDPG